MKKIFLVLLALIATIGASAYTKETAANIRVYINPGHGSWTSNDRPMQLIGHNAYTSTGTDTTGFFESNTNLRKGFGVMEKLIELGVPFNRSLNQSATYLWNVGAARTMTSQIVMSRVKNGPYASTNTTSSTNATKYNRSLTEICAEVNANDFDAFISIHSNAALSASTNYPLFEYRGTDGSSGDKVDGSYEMCIAAIPHVYADEHYSWSRTYQQTVNVRGDISFYGSSSTYGYLGALKHNVKGYLAEGYFHTYLPAAYRAMNWDVDYMEGYYYARGLRDFMGWSKESVGEIYGIARSATETFSHTLYTPRSGSPDVYLPINGATVKLKNSSGVTVATYTTDNQYNGAWVFRGLAPGTYSVVITHPNYAETIVSNITVTAGNTTYATASLADGSSGSNEFYNDPAAQLAYDGLLSPASNYNMNVVYKDLAIAELSGKVIKRVIAHNGLLYILALSKEITPAANLAVASQAVPTIIVYNPVSKAVVANVSTTGAAGSFAAIADIQLTSDGYLLACNGTKNHNEASVVETGDAGLGTAIVYKWANDANGLPTGNPVAWLSTQKSANLTRAYSYQLMYVGSSTEGSAILGMRTTSTTSGSTRAQIITVSGGAQASEYNGDNGVSYTHINKELLSNPQTSYSFSSNDFTLFSSPLAETQLIAIDATQGVRSWVNNGALQNTPSATGSTALNAAAHGHAGFFRYAGAAYLVMPTNAAGANTGLKLFNISTGLADAAEATLSLSEALGSVTVDGLATATAGEAVTTTNASGVVTRCDLNLYLVRNGALTMLSSTTYENTSAEDPDPDPTPTPTPDPVTYEVYPDPAAGLATPADTYDMYVDYQDFAVAQLQGKIIKRVIARNGLLYILALDKEIAPAANTAVADQPVPTIIVFNPSTKAVTEVSTTGTAGSFAAVADIQLTADGYLIACNGTKTQDTDAEVETGDAGRGTFQLYKWANDANGVPTGDPESWFFTQSAGFWFRAYPHMFSYNGSTQNAVVAIPMQTTGSTTAMREEILTIENGEISTDDFFYSTPSSASSSSFPTKYSDCGTDVRIFPSPIAAGNVIMIDSNKGVRAWNELEAFDIEPTAENTGSAAINAAANGHAGIFKYAGASYIAMPANSAEGVNSGLTLFDISSGLSTASAVTLNLNETLANVTVDALATAAAGETLGTDIFLYVVRDGAITRLSTVDPTGQRRKEFAYNLSATDNETSVTVEFDVTGDAPQAALVLTSVADPAKTLTFDLGSVVAGSTNSFDLNKSELEDNAKYNWSIEITSKPITSTGIYSSEAHTGAGYRGGVIPITDPEAASFGYVTLGLSETKSFNVYAPDGTQVGNGLWANNATLGTDATDVSTPFRGNEHNGYAVFSALSNTSTGLVAVDPLQAVVPFGLYAGVANTEGCFVYNSTNLGGGTHSSAFIGEGDDTYIITYSLDHSGTTVAKGELVKYHIGTGWTISEAPVAISVPLNSSAINLDIAAYGNGVWVSQYRSATNNNAYAPYFIYIDDVLNSPTVAAYNSGNDTEVTGNVTSTNTTGIAISRDGKVFAASFDKFIAIFDVTWTAGKPALTYRYKIDTPTHSWAHMRFDYAGNLHVFMTAVGYNVYALADASPEAVSTPAPSTSLISGSTGATGIEDVEIEANDNNAVYYNLQGVEVSADNLTPGIYIRVSNGTSSKVHIK